jgi:hypothetical protein
LGSLGVEQARGDEAGEARSSWPFFSRPLCALVAAASRRVAPGASRRVARRNDKLFCRFDALVPARARGHRETSERLFESSPPH